MDEQLQEDFRRFWREYFESRPGFRPIDLANLIEVRPDLVSHWRMGRNAPSLRNLSRLREEGDLQKDEAAQLFNLCLRKDGFSETSFREVTAACADVIYRLQGSTEQKQ